MSDTEEMVRCSACRGTKKIAKLGGIIGDCKTCNSEGKIKATDKVVLVVSEPVTAISEIINAVSEAVPVMTLELKKALVHVEEKIKVDPKRTLYKRKK